MSACTERVFSVRVSLCSSVCIGMNWMVLHALLYVLKTYIDDSNLNQCLTSLCASLLLEAATLAAAHKRLHGPQDIMSHRTLSCQTSCSSVLWAIHTVQSTAYRCLQYHRCKQYKPIHMQAWHHIPIFMALSNHQHNNCHTDPYIQKTYERAAS